MSKYGLTIEQRGMLEFIERHIAKHRIPPSYEEIRRAFGLASKGQVQARLICLRERGHVTWLRHKPRSLRLVGPQSPVDALPKALRERLDAFCALTGDDPAGVIADAVLLHLDACEEQAA